VKNALSTASTTASVIFRVIEARRPTLLIDEADTFINTEAREELVGILNAGHRASGTVTRCVGDEHEVQTFSVFSPLVLAAIGKLPTTIEDRSVVITMRRRAPGEKIGKFRRRARAALADVRRRCERWASDHLAELFEADPHVPDELHDRMADNWEPLVAIADLAGKAWGAKARAAALALAGQVAGDEAELGVELLIDIKRVFTEKRTHKLPTAELLKALAGLEGRPWEECSKGKPLTARHLSRLLAPFAIQSGKTVRFNPTTTAKGYTLEDFADAFERYCGNPLQFAEVTSDTSARSQGKVVDSHPSHDPACDVASGINSPKENNDVSDVTSAGGGIPHDDEIADAELF
jgi:putative DNA primase/helicase